MFYVPTVTSFTNNEAFIGERVSIPRGSSIKVNDKKAMYINSEEFEISGKLEIGSGSIFIVNTLPKCN